MKILNKLNLPFPKTNSSKLVAILLILIGADSLLAGTTIISGETIVPSPKSTQQEVGLWNVHLYAIPGNDAMTLIGGVENTQNICEKIFFNAKLLGWELTPFERERTDKDFHLLSPSLSKRTLFEGERVGEDTFLGTTADFFPGCGEPVCDEIRSGVTVL